jgi:small-conductance mechanosensitive channel
MDEVNGIQQRLTLLTNDMLGWLSRNGWGVLLAVAGGVAIALVLLALKRWGRKLCARQPGSFPFILGKLVAKTHLWFIAMLAATLMADIASPPPAVARLIFSLFTIAAVLQGAIWVRELVLSLVERRAGAHHELGALGSAMGIIRLLVSAVVFAIALVLILDNLGVNVTGLIAGLGIGGIAIGLAAQGIFSDLFAALSILFDKPFRKGDGIRWDQTNGTVEEIGLKTTRIRSATGEQVVISNANLLNKEIANFARLGWRQLTLNFGIIYQTDPDAADGLGKLVRGIVESVDKCRLVRCGIVNFGASSIDYELRFDVNSEIYDEVFDARHAIAIKLLNAFKERGIEFAYPTQTSFTAAPSGEMILPYPPVAMLATEAVDDQRGSSA